MTRHTPAPWLASGSSVTAPLSSDSSIQIKVARVAGEAEESIANAKLIASAPDYKAARHTLFDAIAHGDQGHRDWLKDAIDKHFAAADAKAEAD